MVRTCSQQKCASVQLLSIPASASGSPAPSAGSLTAARSSASGISVLVKISRIHWASSSCSHQPIRFNCTTLLTRSHSSSRNWWSRKHCLSRLKNSESFPSRPIQRHQLFAAPLGWVGRAHQNDPARPPHQLLIVLGPVLLAQLGRFALARFAGLLFGQAITQHPHPRAFATLWQAHKAHHFFQAVGRDVLYLLFQVDRLALFIFQV